MQAHHTSNQLLKGSRAAQGPRFRPFSTSSALRATHQQREVCSADSRRDVLLQLGSVTAASVLSGFVGELPARAAPPPQVPEVGG